MVIKSPTTRSIHYHLPFETVVNTWQSYKQERGCIEHVALVVGFLIATLLQFTNKSSEKNVKIGKDLTD